MGKVRWQGIVKVQWPLHTHGGEPECMIYDKTRNVMTLIPATEEIRAFMGGKVKVYAEARVDHQGLLHLEKVVSDKTW